MWPIRLEHEHLLDTVVHRIDGARGVCLKAYSIDALLRTLSIGEFVQTLEHALLVEIDGDSAAGFGHLKPLRHVIDGRNLLGAEQHRAPDTELADRASAPYRHGVVGLNIASDRRLPAGGEDIAEE